MRRNKNQREYPGGSLPSFYELERGFNNWVNRLPIIKQMSTAAQREMKKKELADAISGIVLQTVDEGRWQDDGGESRSMNETK